MTNKTQAPGSCRRCGCPALETADQYACRCNATAVPATYKESLTVTPAGYVLVPIEPTPEMVEAGRWSEYGESSLRMSPVGDESVTGVWSDMLAAAHKTGCSSVGAPVVTDAAVQSLGMALEKQHAAYLTADSVRKLTDEQIERAAVAAGFELVMQHQDGSSTVLPLAMFRRFAELVASPEGKQP